jgi:hypothetical protein
VNYRLVSFLILLVVFPVRLPFLALEYVGNIGKVVDDFIYYRVVKFVFRKLTKG